MLPEATEIGPEGLNPPPIPAEVLTVYVVDVETHDVPFQLDPDAQEAVAVADASCILL